MKTGVKTGERIDPSEKMKGNFLTYLKKFLVLTIGAALVAVGIYFFKIQNHFSTGGVSGLSIVLAAVFKQSWLTEGALITGINVVLIILGLLIVGKDFTFKTIYCTLLMSGLTWLFELIYPMDEPLTDQPVLELVFAILLPAAGSAILFYENASTGGTDIVAMIIKKFSDLNISTALLVSDILIVLSTAFVFDRKTFLFCLLGLVSKSLFVNAILDNMNMSKSCTVITSKDHEEEICGFITQTLKKSATVSEAYSSAYLHESKTVIITVLTRKQALRLKKYTKSIDPHSFIIVNSTSTIYGKGFKENI